MCCLRPSNYFVIFFTFFVNFSTHFSPTSFRSGSARPLHPVYKHRIFNSKYPVGLCEIKATTGLKSKLFCTSTNVVHNFLVIIILVCYQCVNILEYIFFQFSLLYVAVFYTCCPLSLPQVNNHWKVKRLTSYVVMMLFLVYCSSSKVRWVKLVNISFNALLIFFADVWLCCVTDTDCAACCMVGWRGDGGFTVTLNLNSRLAISSMILTWTQSNMVQTMVKFHASGQLWPNAPNLLHENPLSRIFSSRSSTQ